MKNPCACCTPAVSSRCVMVPTDCQALCVPSGYTLAPGWAPSAVTAYWISAYRSSSVNGYVPDGPPQLDGSRPRPSGSRMTTALPVPMPAAKPAIQLSLLTVSPGGPLPLVRCPLPHPAASAEVPAGKRRHPAAEAYGRTERIGVNRPLLGYRIGERAVEHVARAERVRHLHAGHRVR